MNPNGGTEQFQYDAVPEQPVNELPKQQAPLIQWKASEFIDHQKSTGWFLPLVATGLAASIIVYFLTRDILAVSVLVLGTITFAVYAKQKPRTLTYTLLPGGIKVGEKSYSYDDFKTFSIIQDGALFTLFLQPIKRFVPPITIYFDPDDGEKIFDTLATHLPHEEREQDPIERFMRKIRF